MGCTVITPVGSNDKDREGHGAWRRSRHNYREDASKAWTRKLTKKKGVDGVVFEHVGADTWAGSMLVLKRGGRIVTCGFDLGRPRPASI